MRFPKLLGDVATFVVAAILVYVVGTALLLVWPMWAMMGVSAGWVLAVLLALGLLAGLFWLLGRRGDAGRREGGARGPAERCPRCGAPVAADYVLCPECHTALQAACPECRRPLKASWTRCPYCGADATAVPSAELSDGAPRGERGVQDRPEVASDERR